MALLWWLWLLALVPWVSCGPSCPERSHLAYKIGEPSLGARSMMECSDYCTEDDVPHGSCLQRGFEDFARLAPENLSIHGAPVVYVKGNCSTGLVRGHIINSAAYGVGAPTMCGDICAPSLPVGFSLGSCANASYGNFMGSSVVEGIEVYHYGSPSGVPFPVYATSTLGCDEVLLAPEFVRDLLLRSGYIEGRCSWAGYPSFVSYVSSEWSGPQSMMLFETPPDYPFVPICSRYKIGVVFPVSFATLYDVEGCTTALETLHAYHAIMQGLESANAQFPDVPLDVWMFDDTLHLQKSPVPTILAVLEMAADPCVLAIMGPLWDSVARQVGPLLTAQNKLMLSVLPSSALEIDKTGGNHLHFRMRTDIAYRAFPALLREFGWQRISVVYEEYFSDSFWALQDELSAQNIAIESVSLVRGSPSLDNFNLDSNLLLKTSAAAANRVATVGSRIIVLLCNAKGRDVITGEVDYCGSQVVAQAQKLGIVGDGYVWLTFCGGAGPVLDAFRAMPGVPGLICLAEGSMDPLDFRDVEARLEEQGVDATGLSGWSVDYFLGVKGIAEAAQINLDKSLDPTSGAYLADRFREGIIHSMQFDPNQDRAVKVSYASRGDPFTVFGSFDPKGAGSVSLNMSMLELGFTPGTIVGDGSAVDVDNTAVSTTVYAGSTEHQNEFSIFSYNSFKEPLSPDVEFTVVIKGRRGANPEVELIPARNGTTSVRYTVSRGGELQISITLLGRHVPGSPFTASVPSVQDDAWKIGLAVSSVVSVLLIFAIIAFYIAFASKRARLDPEFEVLYRDVTLHKSLGIGSFGEVFHADWRGSEVAVKKLLAENLTAEAHNEFVQEVAVMCTLRHPNCLLFMGASTKVGELCIVTEYMEMGDVWSLLENERVPIPSDMRRKWIEQCAKGMSFLHSSTPPILHRDLKTPNLLVSSSWDVKVADFGMSGVKTSNTAGEGGSLLWMAPEVIEDVSKYSRAADVYSFGIIMWEILTRLPLYDGLNEYAVTFGVRRGDRPEFKSNVPEFLQDLVSRAWAHAPSSRPSFHDIINDLRAAPSVDFLDNASDASSNNGALADVPRGKVALAILQIEDENHLWKSTPQSMSEAMVTYNKCIRRAIMKWKGYEAIARLGFIVAFKSPADAVAFAVDIQTRLLTENWPTPLLQHRLCVESHNEHGQVIWRGLRVKIGIHTGTPEFSIDPLTSRGTFFGPVTSLAMKIGDLPRGGQILISDTTNDCVRGQLAGALAFSIGVVNLNGFDRPVNLHQVVAGNLKARTFKPVDHHRTDHSLGSSPVLANAPLIGLVESRSTHESEESMASTDTCVIDMNDLALGEKLGSGPCGVTYKSVLRGKTVAAKKLVRQNVKEATYFEYRAEITMFCNMTHKNVIKILGFTQAPHLTIVYEFAVYGSLRKCLRTPAFSLDSRLKLSILRGIADAMKYLHSHQPEVIHWDLHSANVLVMQDLTPRVTDFGLVRMKRATQTATARGDVSFSAPEVLRGMKCDKSLDVFSFGILMFEVETRSAPYGNISQLQLLKLVVSEDLRPDVPSTMEAGLSDLMCRCWSTFPGDRPSFHEIVQSFPGGGVTLL